MIEKAAGSQADVVFIDLEDSVAHGEKEAARQNVIAGLNTLDFGGTARSFRINATDTQWCHDDLIEVVSAAGANLDFVIVPKVKSARDVWFVADLLTQLESKLGLPLGKIGLEATIEDVEAFENLAAICSASDRLEAVSLGIGDLAASQGMRLGHIGVEVSSYPGDIWHYRRNRLIMAARSAGIDALDGPYAAFGDESGFIESAHSFALLGGTGKWCIHPSQIALSNEVFSPTQAEIEQARAAVDAVRSAEAIGAGSASLDGMMIDAATARSFQVTLDLASACGLL